MGKVKKGIIDLQGKVDDKVIVQGTRKDAHSRNVVKKGSKKKEPAFKKQYERVVHINGLASQINKAMGAYSYGLKSRHFYPLLLKLFRNEKSDNRFLMLQHLRRKEVNDDYAFNVYHLPEIRIELTEKLVIVTLGVNVHSKNYQYQSDCYYFEPVLMQWSGSKEKSSTTSDISEWISIKGNRPIFEFKFRRVPDLQHWLFALRICMGKDEEPLEVKVSQAMQIVDVGTTLPSDLALVKKRERERERERMRNRKKQGAERKRVKAKRYI